MILLQPIAPQENTPFLAYLIELGTELFRIELSWSERLQTYRLDLYDANDDPIYRGKRLVNNTAIGWRHNDPRRYPGQIYLVDQEGSAVDCDFEALGARCLLGYLDPEDFTAPLPGIVPASITKI